MPGCVLFNEADVALPFTNVNGRAAITTRVPIEKKLIGAILYAQAAHTDPAANRVGIAMSHGVAIRIGR